MYGISRPCARRVVVAWGQVSSSRAAVSSTARTPSSPIRIILRIGAVPPGPAWRSGRRGAPCSRSSAHVRPPRPLSTLFALVPRSCTPRCARHSACAARSLLSPYASTHAAIGARPAPAAPRATPSSPAAAPRIAPAAPLFCPRLAAHRSVLVVASVHVYTPSLYSQYSRVRLLVFLSWLRCSRRQPAPPPRCCCLLLRFVARCVHRVHPHPPACVAATLSCLLSHYGMYLLFTSFHCSHAPSSCVMSAHSRTPLAVNLRLRCRYVHARASPVGLHAALSSNSHIGGPHYPGINDALVTTNVTTNFSRVVLIYFVHRRRGKKFDPFT